MSEAIASTMASLASAKLRLYMSSASSHCACTLLYSWASSVHAAIILSSASSDNLFICFVICSILWYAVNTCGIKLATTWEASCSRMRSLISRSTSTLCSTKAQWAWKFWRTRCCQFRIYPGCFDIVTPSCSTSAILREPAPFPYHDSHFYWLPCPRRLALLRCIVHCSLFP